MHFRHYMIGKHFTETSNKVEFQINRVRINRVRHVAEMIVEGDDIVSPFSLTLLLCQWGYYYYYYYIN